MLLLGTLALVGGVAQADYYLAGGRTRDPADAGADGGDASDGGTQGQPLKWPTATVEYRISAAGLGGNFDFPDGTDEAAVVAAINAAFDTWNAVPCSGLQFVPGEREDEVRQDPYMATGFTPHILVFFSKDPGLFDAPRVGTFEFIEDGMKNLISGVVILNTKDHSWSTDQTPGTLDIQSVVTAFIGRDLGITSDEAGNATYGVYNAGDISKRTLGEDDIAAMQYLYGGEGCPDVPPPAMVCMTPDILMNCPPQPTVDGGFADGGTADGAMRPDATPDASVGDDDDDDCSCAVVGATDPDRKPLGLALFALAMVAVIARRRRK